FVCSYSSCTSFCEHSAFSASNFGFSTGSYYLMYLSFSADPNYSFTIVKSCRPFKSDIARVTFPWILFVNEMIDLSVFG
ncbi:MAG: hypothetical protein WC780_01245, partial [Lentimicrobiaceae bacterium]